MTRSELDKPGNATEKSKKKSRFLGQQGSLELALSIASLQEDKSQSRAKKHHEEQVGRPREERPPVSASRLRLKATKAAILAERSRVKKNKIKLRKASNASKSRTSNTQVAIVGPAMKKKKSVSFA